MTSMFDQDAPGLLQWLQVWYAAQCDGDWEHTWGVSIGTLDNPGWQVKINLNGTSLAPRAYERIETHRDEHDWVVSWVGDTAFNVACGPLNLSEGLHLFRSWVESSG